MEVLTSFKCYLFASSQSTWPGYRMGVNIIYLAAVSILCINFWHIVCITSWFQGTHNMFGFYTAFVVNVIKCRSKYKKYSKRIPTSKTGKMRKMPGQGQHWQQRLLGFHPKPLDSPSFCVFLHLNQNIDSLYFEAYRFLKVLWRKIFV